MARPKAFDPDQVLDKAMEMFWSRGYKNTSMQDLVDCMCINRGSLYDTFGDKHALYLKALNRYMEKHSIRMLAADGDGHPAREVIRGLLYHLAEEKDCDSDQRGCFITNTICELCSCDSDVAQTMQQGLARMQGALQEILEGGQRSGEFAKDLDCHAAAGFFLNTIHGMQVMRKVQPDPAILKSIADQAVGILR